MPFDQAPPGHARPGDGAGPGPRPSWTCPSSGSWPCCPGSRPRIAGLGGEHGGPIAVGRPANLCVIDPAAKWVVDPAALASRSRNTPYAGRALVGPGPPHRPPRRARRHRRGGAAMTTPATATTRPPAATARRRPCWSWPTAPSSRARRSAGGTRTAGPATGEVVFNTALTGYQEVITDPSYAGQIIVLHLSPHRQLRDHRRPTTRAGGPSAGASSCATWPPGRAAGARQREPRRLPRRAPRRRASPGSTPAASPATSATPAPCRAPSARSAARAPSTRRRSKRPPRPSRAPTASTWSPRSPPPSPTRSATGPLRVVAYDFGIKRTILRHLGRLATVEVVPASTPAAEVLARRPDGVFLSNGPGDPAAVGYAADAIARPARPGADLRDLPRPPAAGRPPSAAAPTSCRSAITAATTRCAGWRPARSRSPARTTTTPSPTAAVARRRRHPRQPQRRRHRGPGLPRRARLQRPVPPRGRARAPRRQLPVRGVPRL